MSNSTALTVRPATEADVKAIFALLELYAAQKIVLQRSEADIRYYLANFSVAEREGELVGCVAMRDFGNDLLEIRSLVVAPELQNTGVGRALVEYCIRKLRNSRQRFRLFALTLKADFFVRLGFRVVGKELFPEKIWSDCLNCPKKECCDELAVMLKSDD